MRADELVCGSEVPDDFRDSVAAAVAEVVVGYQSFDPGDPSAIPTSVRHGSSRWLRAGFQEWGSALSEQAFRVDGCNVGIPV
jgi:hypothetical protein